MYTVRAEFDGRVRYFKADNETDARYLAGVICADLRNGNVQILHGLACLFETEIRDGQTEDTYTVHRAKLV
jgi:hypothetical protein